MKKRLIAALLAVSMLVPSGSALAVRLPEQRTERIYSTSTYINPLYRNEMTAAQLKTTREEDASEGSTQYVTSETELCDQLREDLMQRKSTITLHYQSNTYDKQDAENFFKKAVAHTGKPTEGDYLKWQYAGWEATQSGNVLYDDQIHDDVVHDGKAGSCAGCKGGENLAVAETRRKERL